MKLAAPLALLALFAGACGSPKPAPRSAADADRDVARFAPRTRLVMDPIKLQAHRGDPEPRVEVIEPEPLFDHGSKLLSARKNAEAVAAYDKLLKHFPDSRFVSPALYNAGLAHENLKQFDQAAKRYRELLKRFGERKEAIDAAFRLGGCYAELRNWPASVETFAWLLERKDLSISDRIESMARKGLAHFRLGDHRKCRSTLMAAVRFHKSVEAVERLDSDFFLAMIHYYLGALPHVDFRNLKVDTGAAMATTLDDKARLLLLSQAKYIEAIKVKNAYWATAAGFQIGSLYREFYTVLLTRLPDFKKQAKQNAAEAKIPYKEAHKQLVQVYMEEVHKAVKPLLTKAIRVFEKNIVMAQRVGIESNWVGKSRYQVNELKHLMNLKPEEAVKLVKEGEQVPEDQPAQEPPPPPEPPTLDTAPNRPTDTPPRDQGDEPGKVIL